MTVAGPRLAKQPGKEGGANSRVARLPRGLGAAWGCDGVGCEAAAQELDCRERSWWRREEQGSESRARQE